MEWYSIPIVVDSKQEVKKGIYTNYYLGYKTQYVDGKEVKEGMDSVAVPKNIFDNVKEGDKIQLTRQTFYHRKNKKFYDFISEFNPSK